MTVDPRKDGAARARRRAELDEVCSFLVVLGCLRFC